MLSRIYEDPTSGAAMHGGMKQSDVLMMAANKMMMHAY